MADGNGSSHVDPARIAAIEKALGIGDPAAEAASYARLKAGAEEQAVAEAQAASEGVPLTGQVEFLGQFFRLGAKVGLMPILKFAHASSKGLGADDMEGMAAMYAMIRDCIAEKDWPRFEAAAIDGHADGDDLMKVVEQAMQEITARPTRQPPGSSPPGQAPLPRSRGLSSSPEELPEAFRRLAEKGDLLEVESFLRSPG